MLSIISYLKLISNNFRYKEMIENVELFIISRKDLAEIISRYINENWQSSILTCW